MFDQAKRVADKEAAVLDASVKDVQSKIDARQKYVTDLKKKFNADNDPKSKADAADATKKLTALQADLKKLNDAANKQRKDSATAAALAAATDKHRSNKK